MSTMLDIGDRKGRLLILANAGIDERNRRLVIVRCDCGSPDKIVQLSNVRQRPGTISCGCARREASAARKRTHGMRRTRVYSTWCAMLRRVTSEKRDGADYYVGRGIDVDPRWREFEAFHADMGDPPSPRHEIDRIDGCKGYWPLNCRWATDFEQGANKSNNIRVILRGETVIMTEALRRLGITDGATGRRMRKLGWTHQEAIDFYAERAREK